MEWRITDWSEFEPGHFWHREGPYMIIKYPVGQTPKLPIGYNGEMLVDRVITPVSGQAIYKIQGWSNNVVMASDGPSSSVGSELVAFVRDTGLDSHNGMHDGKYTIAVSGRYQYKLAGLKAVQSDFKAGDVIPYELEFIFKERSK